jgi:hypothetical protein
MRQAYLLHIGLHMGAPGDISPERLNVVWPSDHQLYAIGYFTTPEMQHGLRSGRVILLLR